MHEGEENVGSGSGVSTGHPGVDAAMAAIETLGDADLATHVATFERAHEALRTALTSPAEVAGEEDAPSTTDL